ncbi:hypothetical protein BAUCODRAFT_39107, partial [Baudoinia panamericana UAMH 10762]
MAQHLVNCIQPRKAECRSLSSVIDQFELSVYLHQHVDALLADQSHVQPNPKRVYADL